MFTEHSWRCGGTKSHSRSPFRDYTLWSRWQGEAGQRRVFWHSRFTIHPLGFYCFRFGSNWAATWARLRPRVQTLLWLHISAVIKLATRQNRLQLYSRRCVSGHAPPPKLYGFHFRKITCNHMLELKGNLDGKIWHFEFRLSSEMKASNRERLWSPLPDRQEQYHTHLPTHVVMRAHKT